MTTEQTEAVKGSILDKIMELRKSADIRRHFHRPRWLALIYANNASLQLLEGAALDVVEGAEMSHNVTLVAYLPDSHGYSTKKSLDL